MSSQNQFINSKDETSSHKNHMQSARWIIILGIIVIAANLRAP